MSNKTMKKIFSIILSISLLLQIGLPAAYAEGGDQANTSENIESSTQEITIISFAELSENEKYITVPLGTVEEELSLPETVTATLEYDIYEEEGGDVLENRVDEDVALAVTWASDKDFSSIAEAEFIYTAKLTDENYILAEGVEIPKINVRVEKAVGSSNDAPEMILYGTEDSKQKTITITEVKIYKNSSDDYFYNEIIKVPVGTTEDRLKKMLANNWLYFTYTTSTGVTETKLDFSVKWAIENGDINKFDSTTPGAKYTYLPVIPETVNIGEVSYEVILTATLPKTEVHVGNDLWVGDTQIIKGSILTGITSGDGWCYDNSTNTLTMNGANITKGYRDTQNYSDNGTRTIDKDGVSGIYSDGDLNIVLEGADSNINIDVTVDKPNGNQNNGIKVFGNLSISGSAKLTAVSNRNGINVTGDLNINININNGTALDGIGASNGIIANGNIMVSGSSKVRGIGENSVSEYSYGISAGSITVADTAILTGHAKVNKQNYGVKCRSGNITIGSGATLIARADDGYWGESSRSYGLDAGYWNNTSVGLINVEGTLVGSCGHAPNKGFATGIAINKIKISVSGNGSVRAESGTVGGDGAKSYGLSALNSEVTINGGGFRAAGGSGAVDPSTTKINISSTPVLYEVSGNRDGSSPTVITSAEDWESVNGNFAAYKYIQATKTYSDYINGIQVIRTNIHDVLGDGTVSYIEALGDSPARLTLKGTNFGGDIELNGDTEIILEGDNSIGSLESKKNITLSGNSNLTVNEDINFADVGLDPTTKLIIENGASLTTKGKINTNTLINNGTLANESANAVTVSNFDNNGLFTNTGTLTITGDFTSSGSFVNEGRLVIPKATEEVAKSIIGEGITEVKGVGEDASSVYYINGIKLITVLHSLDFTKDAGKSGEQGGWNEDATLENNGYQWDNENNTLTMRNLMVDVTSRSAITIPADTTVVLKSVNFINSNDSSDGYGICGKAGLKLEGGGYLKVISNNIAIATLMDDSSGTINIGKDMMIVIPTKDKIESIGKIASIDGKNTIVLENDESSAVKEVIITSKYDQQPLIVNDIGKKTYGNESFQLLTSGGSGTGIISFESSDPTIVSIEGDMATIHKVGTVNIIATKAEDRSHKEITSAPLSVTISNRPSSGESTPTTETITTVIGGTANVKVSQKTITDAIQKAQAEAKKSGTEKDGISVEIKVDTKNITATNISVNLTNKTVDELAKAGVKEFIVNSDLVTVSLDIETLKTIQNEIKTDVNLSAEKVDTRTLSAEEKEVVGDRPVFDFSITGTNGEKVRNFGKGKSSISIPYILGAGEKAENITIYYINEQGHVEEMSNSHYNEENGTISFETDHFSKFAVGYKENIIVFTDIENHWAKNDIEFVTARGLFSGTGDNKFSPDMSMTRGMFVTVLGRLAQADTNNYKESSFVDVKIDAYYMPSTEWAKENNIVNGISATEFAPEQPITREQMAVIMENYSKSTGFELPKVKAENIFTDSEQISRYAKVAVKQMQMAGIISGKDNNKFEPQGTATRAEVSAVLKRFIGVVEK